MKTVYFLRHAKSDWNVPQQDDFDRPLNARGIKSASLIGQEMQDQNLIPQLVLCSAAQRTRETFRLIQEEISKELTVRFLEELYLAPPLIIFSLLQKAPDELDSLMILSHNPGLESIYETLTKKHESYPTCALSIFDFPIESWKYIHEDQKAHLKTFLKPKALPSWHMG